MSINYWYKQGDALLEEIETTKVPQGGIALWFLGQESMVMKQNDTILYIDPYFSEPLDAVGHPKRKFAPPFKPEEIKHADWVLCTHNHSDHLDPYALSGLASGSPQARFLVPSPHTHILAGLGISSERIVAAKAGVKAPLSGAVYSIPVPAAHEEYETDPEGEYLCLGYVIDWNGIRLYHSGDCMEKPDTVERLKPLDIDIACLPINGSDWTRKRKNIIGNMNAREAANVAAECGADLVIPLHFDLFAHNGENPAHFADYMYACYPARKYHIMVPGERFIYLK